MLTTVSDNSFPVPDMRSLGMDPAILRALQSLGSAWRDWLFGWSEMGRDIGSRAMNRELTKVLADSADPWPVVQPAVLQDSARRLAWLEDHPSPDEEFNRRMAEFLRGPKMLQEVSNRAEAEGWSEDDDERSAELLIAAMAATRNLVTQLQARAVELLRGR
jgi:hypothetical protein